MLRTEQRSLQISSLQLPSELPMITTPHLTMERGVRSESMSFDDWLEIVSKWVEARPLIRWSDSKKYNIAKLLLGEIDELAIELNKAQTPEEFTEVWKEAVDCLFFAVSYFSSNHMEPDSNLIRRQMNGWDISQSHIDYLRSLAAQVDGIHSVATLQRFISVWSSMVVKLEHWQEVEGVLCAVIDKNTNNYPAEYLQLRSKLSDGQLIILKSEFDKQMALEHRIRCLRTIRSVLKIVRPDDPAVRTQDHRPYSDLILNYGVDAGGVYDKHVGDSNYYQLCMGLVSRYRQLGLSLEMILYQENRPHKLVQPTDGVLRPGQDLQVSQGSFATARTVQLVQ